MLTRAASARLGEADCRALLDFVGTIHDAQDLDELRGMLLGSLRQLVPADYASYNEIPAEAGEHISIVEPDLPASAYEAWERLAHTNPLVERFARTRDGRAYRFSDVVERAALHRMPIYRELYAPHGIEHQIAIVLPSPPTLVIGVALSRGGPHDFDDRERAMLDLLRPHMIQAYRNAQLRERSCAVLAALRTRLDARRTPDPAMLRDLGLTPREAEVLALLARGCSTADAAAQLHVSTRTILKHMERIHRKLGVTDRAQAIATAWLAGDVTVAPPDGGEAG